MASTTSTEQSGLFAHLLPAFKAATGLDVKVVAVGTGQAIDMGRRGDADVLFVHDQAAEEKLVQEGFALRRLPVMYNDFVLVEPANDPARLRGKDIVSALQKAAAGPAAFISRGDRSGTHAAELRYWKLAGMDAPKLTAFKVYKECGCGMGPALNMAASMGAYVLTDRGTWLNFRNRADLAVWRAAGQPGQTPPCECGRCHPICGVGHVTCWAGRDRQLQDRRRAVILPQCQSLKLLQPLPLRWVT
jgi:tungstate transport system substrate-binding protein